MPGVAVALATDAGAGDQRNLKLARAGEIRAAVCHQTLIGENGILGEGVIYANQHRQDYKPGVLFRFHKNTD